MALLIILAAVVLITVLILAFFNRASISRRISFSSTSQIKAQMLAQSSLDLIVGQLRQQIVDGSLSGAAYTANGVTIYPPKNATYLLPVKQPGLSADTVGATTILYLSANGSVLDPNASSTLQLPFGSSVTIDTPSLNGRSEDHWFTEGPQLGSSTIFPAWVFVTQSSNLVPGTTLVSNITTTPVTTAKTTDSNYVIGRFAYTVYDISGLLNANVAGYPSLMDTDSNHYPTFKSSQAYADLSIPTLGTTGDSLTAWRNPDDNASASAYVSYLQNYGMKYGFLQTEVGDSAFLSRRDLLNAAANGIAGLSSSSPNYFTSYSRCANAPSWSPNQDAISIQPGGINSYAYKANAETTPITDPNNPPATISNPNRDIPNVRFMFGDANSHAITHYRDDGTSFSYSVQSGDPLIQYRFSLAKLAWLTPKGPSATLAATDPFYNAGGSAAAVQACFGLNWVGGSTEHWEYDGYTGSTLLSSIDALDQIATEIQNGTRTTEPNFFELLKAGILCGSIGTFSQDATMASKTISPPNTPTQITLEKNTDIHILKIGANIINCAANHNYPVVIAFSPPSFPALEFAGVVDLPYFYSLQNYVARLCSPTNTGANGTPGTNDVLTYCDMFWTPIFFNPNRSVSALSVTPIDTAHSPSQLQVNFAPGSTLTSMRATPSVISTFVAAPNINKDLSAGTTGLTPITITRNSQNDYDTFRNTPQATTDAPGGAHTFSTLYPYSNLSNNYLTSTFRVYSYENEEADKTNTATWRKYSYIFQTTYPPGQVAITPNFQGVLLRLQYFTPGGNWKTYTTLGGQENCYGQGSSNGIASIACDVTGKTDTKTGDLQFGPNFDKENVGYLGAAANTYAYAGMLNNFDPRTNRLGPCGSGCAAFLPSLSSLVIPTSSSLETGINQYQPYPSARNNDLNKTFFGLWPQGGKGYDQLGSATAPSAYSEQPSGTGITPVFNFPDPDGIFRPADGWLESSVDATNTTNLYTQSNLGTATVASRPVILHRPYRSVAELGYVFRDNAWKTLDFFDGTSGDGALLDLFCISDQPAITAGRVNLNTQQPLVQQALFSKASWEPDGTSTISQTVATSLASAYNSYAYASSGLATSTLPVNSAQLTQFMSDDQSQITSAGFDNIKYHREAAVRALAETTQTRTWNLLIDVVAQTGRYPTSASNTLTAANFLVEGEKRYWLSISIDRFTGKIVDQQLEPVNQ